MRVAVAIELTDVERTVLTKWSRGRSTPVRLVLRAKIVLLAAEGGAQQGHCRLTELQTRDGRSLAESLRRARRWRTTGIAGAGRAATGASPRRPA